ncbi:MAG: hypothetical protein E7600_06260 [Ruminococcaceae bacterium]|nr:hypothetical protein [Oscillospiraceae bacterium]
MKRYWIHFLISISIIFLFCSCGVTFDGYRSNLDEERKASGYYDEYNYLFTVQKDDYIVDFVVYDEHYSIITIYTRGENNKQYNVRSCSTGSISASLYYTNELDKYYWVEHWNMPFKKSILIVSKSYNDSHEKLNGFEFEYRGEPHLLCYKFGD